MILCLRPVFILFPIYFFYKTIFIVNETDVKCFIRKKNFQIKKGNVKIRNSKHSLMLFAFHFKLD